MRSVGGTSGPRDVVGRHEAALEGKATGCSSLPRRERKLIEDVAEQLARERVLALVEPHVASRREHPVGEVGVLAPPDGPGHEAVDPWHEPGPPGGDPEQRVPADVGDHRLVEPVRQLPLRVEVGVGRKSLEATRQRRVGIGEPEELEVVVALHEVVELAREHGPAASARRRRAVRTAARTAG